MSEELNPAVRIGPYAPGDETAILETFRVVFGKEKSLEDWTWAYRKNPAGTHVWLAKTEEGRVVSQFCSVPRRVWTREGARVFGEIVDSMTHPDYRQGLRRAGWFARTCWEFVEHFGRPDGEAVMYGLPLPAAFRIGKRLMGYEHLHHVHLLSRPLEGGGTGSGPIREVSAFGPEAERLFLAAAPRYGLAVWRDAEYLAWRYTRPGVRYRRFLFTEGGPEAAFGFAVLREDWTAPGESALAELCVADPGDPRVPTAIESLVAMAASGGEVLRAWCVPGTAESTGLMHLGFIEEKSHFRHVGRTYEPRLLPIERLRDGWFVTLGDFDVV